MAQRTVVTVVCDLPHDGEAEGKETVSFSFDGVAYEIDVCTAHAKELHDTLMQYANHARKAAAAVPDWSRARAQRGDQSMGAPARPQGKRARADPGDHHPGVRGGALAAVSGQQLGPIRHPAAAPWPRAARRDGRPFRQAAR